MRGRSGARESQCGMHVRAPIRRSVWYRVCAAVASWALLAGVTGCSLGSDPVESQWESRDSLTSCGSLRLGQMDTLEVDGKTEVACLQRALISREGAELVVRYPTTEGDPVTDYYRVTATGSTEVYTDATQDAFSDGKWHYGSCNDPKTALDLSC